MIGIELYIFVTFIFIGFLTFRKFFVGLECTNNTLFYLTITDKKICEEFKNYLKTEFCAENIDFYVAVTNFKESFPENKFNLMNYIYYQFIDENADFQVHFFYFFDEYFWWIFLVKIFYFILQLQIVIPSDVKESIFENVQSNKIEKDLFDKACELVVSILKNDCFPRFYEKIGKNRFLINQIWFLLHKIWYFFDMIEKQKREWFNIRHVNPKTHYSNEN